MPKISRSEQFNRSYSRLRGSGELDRDTFLEFSQTLGEDERLPPEWNEHTLTREWTGYWDAHLANDVVVIYKRAGNEVRLVDIGKHADFFANFRKMEPKSIHPPGSTKREREKAIRHARRVREKGKSVASRWPGRHQT